jgi:hypothetical protein
MPLAKLREVDPKIHPKLAVVGRANRIYTFDDGAVGVTLIVSPVGSCTLPAG